MSYTHKVDKHEDLTTARESFLIYLPFQFNGAGRNVVLEDNAWFACYSSASSGKAVAKRSPNGPGQTHELVGAAKGTTIKITQAAKRAEFVVPQCGSYSFGEIFSLRPPPSAGDKKPESIKFVDLSKWAPEYQAPGANSGGQPFRPQSAGTMPFLYNLSPVIDFQGKSADNTPEELTSTLGIVGPFLGGGFLEAVHKAGSNVAAGAAGLPHPEFLVSDGGTKTPVFKAGSGSGKGNGYALVLAGDFAPAYAWDVQYLFWNNVFRKANGDPNALAESLREYVEVNAVRREAANKEEFRAAGKSAYHPGYDIPCELYYVSGLNGIKTPRIGRLAP